MILLYKPQVLKQLQKLPNKEKKKVIKKILLLKESPYSGKTLRGELKSFRSFRAWPYRIIYKLNKKNITIYSIAHRQSSYK